MKSKFITTIVVLILSLNTYENENAKSSEIKCYSYGVNTRQKSIKQKIFKMKDFGIKNFVFRHFYLDDKILFILIKY